MTVTAHVNVTFDGSITPTGTIQFLVDGLAVGQPVPLSQGVATFTTTNLNVGNHLITTRYSSDNPHLADSTSGPLAQPVFSAMVASTHLFYKGSTRFNVTNSNLPGFSDDNAIAPDKTAYLPGSGGSAFSAVSSYTRGINGLMVDMAGAHGAITANDFVFKVGNNNSPSTWNSATAPIAVSVRSGAGTGGSDRIELIWADNAIQQTWLEVIVEGNDALGGFNTNTGLASSYVFYFGNALGDSGSGDPTTFLVSSTDEQSARNNPKSVLGTPATITDVNDFNRDGNVNTSDQVVSRNYATNALTTALKFLNVGAGGPFAPNVSDPAASPLNSVSSGSDVSTDTQGDSGLASGVATLSSFVTIAGGSSAGWQGASVVSSAAVTTVDHSTSAEQVLYWSDLETDDLLVDEEMLDSLLAELI